MSATQTATGERADLLASLAKQRHFMRYPTRGLTDEQAAKRTTVSELCLGGLIKHVAVTEQQWARFIVEGPSVMSFDPRHDGHLGAARSRWPTARPWPACSSSMRRSRARPTSWCAACLTWTRRTRCRRRPGSRPASSWSARRVLLHIIAETAQHAGHADIIREALDGAKSMG